MNLLPLRILFISFLILFANACEEIVWDNPYDANTALGPSDWSPKNLQAQVLSDSQIKLTWEQDEKRIVGFRIERQEYDGSWEQIGEVTADITQFTDTELSVEIEFTYRVNAFTKSNQSAYAVSNTTSTSFPSPTNLIVTAQNDSDILLEWTDNCDFEEGFRIERQKDGGSWGQIAEVLSDVTQQMDTGLSYGPTYSYRVYAFTASNQSGYIVSNSTSTSFPAPSDLTTTVQNETDILLEWTDNCSFEEGFRIERQEEGGSWIQIGKVAADVSQYTDTGLTYGANYTYRVYAYNINNQSYYSNIIELYLLLTVTDIDGNVYQTVKIGDQWWMAENLKVTHYRNGDDVNNTATYGILYNWYTVHDNRNIAPLGWHIPTDAEWQTLIDYLGGWSVAGGKMKETGTTHWVSPNTGATNESGFTALPGGYLNSSGNILNRDHRAYLWSSTEHDGITSWSRRLWYTSQEVTHHSGNKQYGYSIRCIRD